MNASYQMPAEWEHQWGIQLTWPHKGTDWAPMMADIEKVYVQMAREIIHRENLLIVTPEPERIRELLSMELGSDDASHILYFHCETNDTWARDHGFITLKSSEELHAPNRLLDFRFNGWGEKFAAEKDNSINRQLMISQLLQGEYEDHLDFVLEGGSIESDGQGTIFTTSRCLMAPRRNQPLSQDDIETRLKKYLNAQRVIWINHGQLSGDDTDGHIDTIMRIAPNKTLIYVGCDNPNDEQYADLLALERQLQALRTLHGCPYRLVRLPMPPPIYEGTERLPATYANFLILNGAILVPTYGQTTCDEMALQLIANAFPGRDIIGINSLPIIRQHGSIHCCTMQYYE